jgi:uncharacterized phage-associated protein
MNTYGALEIANKIICKSASEDCGELVSNLKLQKLLYYMQGFHLAYFNTPLFNEDIEAWLYGPVVPVVYNKYKRYGNKGIGKNGAISISLDDAQEDLFYDVFSVYSIYSASGLMNLTHKEPPWKTTETGAGNVISHKKMKDFFKTRIKK